jgi:hypothetical protein
MKVYDALDMSTSSRCSLNEGKDSLEITMSGKNQCVIVVILKNSGETST